MVKRTYAILGTGALGGFYGAKLQKSGLEVHYLLKSDYQQVRESLSLKTVILSSRSRSRG